MKTLFIGRGRMALMVLARLLEDGVDVARVVVADMHNDVIGGSNEDFRELAAGRGVPCMVIKDINDEAVCAELAAVGAEYGVCVQWPRMLGRRAVETVSRGFLNFHASLLPRYRGNASNNWALVLGEETVGATVHLMLADNLDNGPIVLQRAMDVGARTRIADIVDFTLDNAPGMMSEALAGLEAGTLAPVPQDEAQAVRSYSRLPLDGEIDWSADPETIDRLVRAAGPPYPGAFTFLDGRRLVILDGAPLDPGEQFVGMPGHIARLLPQGHIAVITGHGGMFEVRRVRLGDYEGVPTGVVRSIKKRLGMHASLEIEALKERVAALERLLDGRKGEA